MKIQPLIASTHKAIICRDNAVYFLKRYILIPLKKVNPKGAAEFNIVIINV